MVTIAVGITYRQQQTPDHLLSTVNVVGRMIAVAGQPLGAVIALVSGVTTAYAIAAVTIATTALLSRRFLRPP